MNQTSLVGRPLHSLVTRMVSFAEKRGVWSGPLMSSSPELARLWASPPTSTGVSVSEMSALTYSVVWACVNNISTDVASLPLILYKTLPNGGKERLKDHKLYRLLHDEPNSEMCSMTFRGVIQAHALTWGNGYAEIQRDGAGRPVALWPITPDRVAVKRETRTGRLFYDVMQPGGGSVSVDPANMLHLTGLGYDGSIGYNLIAHAREAIALGLATERFGGSFFGNGATFGGVISLKETLTEAAKISFREQMQAQHVGVDRAHKFLLLGNEASYEKLGVDPDHAQFLQTRENQVEEICRYYRMPPHKVQHLLRSTNNNIEHQGIEYYSDTLRPWCVRWEQELKRKLIAPSERMIQFVEHKIEGVLRGDLNSRYQAYAVGRQWGWLSANRICELENMDPLPAGGDVFLVPLNMTPADRLNEIIDKQVAPDPAPVAPAPPPAMPDDDDEEDEADRMVAAIRTALVDVEARIAEQAAARAMAEAQLGTVSADHDTLKADLEAHCAQERAARDEAARLQAVLLLAQERVDQLQAEAAARAQETDNATATWQQAVDAAQREAEQAKAAAADDAIRLQQALSDAEARAAQSAADQSALASTVASAQATIAQLQADLQAATARHAETAAEREAAQMAQHLAQTQLTDLQAAMAETTRELERLAAERDLVKATAETEAQRAERAHQAMQEATAQLAKVTADATAASQLLAEETARVTAEREAHGVTQRALETVSVATSSATAAADAARLAAERAVEEAAAARAQAEQIAAERATQLAAEQAARAEAEAALDRLRAEDAARTQARAIAYRSQLLATAGYLVNKERRAATRNKLSPTKLKAWAQDFYVLHEETCIDALRPCIRIHLANLGSTTDVDTYTRAKIHPQIEAALAQIRAVCDGDQEEFPEALERLLTKWERERPTALADLIQQEAVTHV